jgi:hypothetical protein
VPKRSYHIQSRAPICFECVSRASRVERQRIYLITLMRFICYQLWISGISKNSLSCLLCLRLSFSPFRFVSAILFLFFLTRSDFLLSDAIKQSHTSSLQIEFKRRSSSSILWKFRFKWYKFFVITSKQSKAWPERAHQFNNDHRFSSWWLGGCRYHILCVHDFCLSFSHRQHASEKLRSMRSFTYFCASIVAFYLG